MSLYHGQATEGINAFQSFGACRRADFEGKIRTWRARAGQRIWPKIHVGRAKGQDKRWEDVDGPTPSSLDAAAEVKEGYGRRFPWLPEPLHEYTLI